MSQKIYLALYKGRRNGNGLKAAAARVADWLARKTTRGQYSHCEIAVEISDGLFECYTASLRDGGVRCKTMRLPSEKWDLVELPSAPSNHACLDFVWQTTKGKRYDLWGAVGVILKTVQRHDRWFCSEWCGVVMGYKETWRFSPNDLAVIAAKRSNENR